MHFGLLDSILSIPNRKKWSKYYQLEEHSASTLKHHVIGILSVEETHVNLCMRKQISS